MNDTTSAPTAAPPTAAAPTAAAPTAAAPTAAAPTAAAPTAAATTAAAPTAARGPRPGLLRGALTGLALGAAWGVAARVFMRLVSDNPGFSWAGTLGIVAVAAWYGAFVGAAGGALRAGRRGWWRVLALPALFLFAGPGLPFLPGALLGAVALSRRSRVGVVGAVLANLVVPVLLWQDGRLDEVTMLSAPYRAQVATLVLMPLLGLALAWWAQALFAARPAGRRSAQSPSPDLARSSRRNESSLAAPAGPA